VTGEQEFCISLIVLTLLWTVVMFMGLLQALLIDWLERLFSSDNCLCVDIGDVDGIQDETTTASQAQKRLEAI
jgi:hypothetical protein